VKVAGGLESSIFSEPSEEPTSISNSQRESVKYGLDDAVQHIEGSCLVSAQRYDKHNNGLHTIEQRFLLAYASMCVNIVPGIR
jgi:hypothetical protein